MTLRTNNARALFVRSQTIATDVLANGVPDAQVAELLGHSGTAMLHRHYAHLTARARTLKEALDRVRRCRMSEWRTGEWVFSFACSPIRQSSSEKRHSPFAFSLAISWSNGIRCGYFTMSGTKKAIESSWLA